MTLASATGGPTASGQTFEVEGTFNVRDVGGVSTSDGATVATGRLFRSASLDALTDPGLDVLRGLGMRTVIDLRSQSEVDHSGRFPVDEMPVRWEHLVSSVTPPAGDDQRSVDMRTRPDPMTPMYLEIMSTSGPMFARGLRILAEADTLPAIVHCTSGKDRTGLFVVLLHLVLVVPLERALVEYRQDDTTTERAVQDMLKRYPQMQALGDEKMLRTAGTDPEWVIAALDSIGGEHAVPEWLASHGCDADDQAKIRANFFVERVQSATGGEVSR